LQPLPGVLTEKKYIEKSLFWLRLIRDVKLTICENVTRGILADELERDPPDILHYIGHSSFDSARNKAFLALEPEPAAHDKDSGSARHLIPPQESALPEKKHYEEFEAEELGNLLSDSPVKLVILNSCEGAVAAQTDAFVGIAQNLVGAGVPAVVAMQYPIYDQSALLFSKIFYSSFIKNYSIDEAVTSARLHISRRIGLSKQDWATPVLFMRTHDENIFKIE
jgi:CHAT domain-containing protein